MHPTRQVKIDFFPRNGRSSYRNKEHMRTCRKQHNQAYRRVLCTEPYWPQENWRVATHPWTGNAWNRPSRARGNPTCSGNEGLTNKPKSSVEEGRRNSPEAGIGGSSRPGSGGTAREAGTGRVSGGRVTAAVGRQQAVREMAGTWEGVAAGGGKARGERREGGERVKGGGGVSLPSRSSPGARCVVVGDLGHTPAIGRMGADGRSRTGVCVVQGGRRHKRWGRNIPSSRPTEIHSVFGWLVADGWCWFVLREEYCWLVTGGWFVLREKYCWLVADKPSECCWGSGDSVCSVWVWARQTSMGLY
jgi:hypothetical protein